LIISFFCITIATSLSPLRGHQCAGPLRVATPTPQMSLGRTPNRPSNPVGPRVHGGIQIRMSRFGDFDTVSPEANHDPAPLVVPAAIGVDVLQSNRRLEEPPGERPQGRLHTRFDVSPNGVSERETIGVSINQHGSSP
jgi:hypothetical protein